MKWGIVAAAIAITFYFFKEWVLFLGFLWVLSWFSGDSSTKSEKYSGLSKDDLDGERDPAWDGRDMNEIYDNDGLGDWDIDGLREEKF